MSKRDYTTMSQTREIFLFVLLTHNKKIRICSSYHHHHDPLAMEEKGTPIRGQPKRHMERLDG
jgi:hypothetical protein